MMELTEITANSPAERRREPRFDVSLPATLVDRQGTQFSGRIINISRSGMQIEVNNECIPLLMPNMGRRGISQPLPLLVTMSLPDEFPAVQVYSGIVYFNRLTRTTSGIGCRFESFLEKGASVLHDYIVSLR